MHWIALAFDEILILHCTICYIWTSANNSIQQTSGAHILLLCIPHLRLLLPLNIIMDETCLSCPGWFSLLLLHLLSCLTPEYKTLMHALSCPFFRRKNNGRNNFQNWVRWQWFNKTCWLANKTNLLLLLSCLRSTEVSWVSEDCRLCPRWGGCYLWVRCCASQREQ